MSEIQKILEKYKVKTKHANQVKTYALMLFDVLNSRLFEYSEIERSLLETASLLHDIGYFIDSKSHHKHSLDLILKTEIDGFDAKGVETIAHLARYHRSSLPDESRHKRFFRLENFQKEIILKLGPLLRIADGLDNPHKNLITGIEFDESKSSFLIILRTIGFAPKLSRANAKKDFFEAVYKKPVEFVIKKIA